MSLLGNIGSTALNITMTVTPQGRGLGLASELLGGGAQDMVGALADTLMKGLFGDANKNGISKINDWDKGSKTADNPLLQMLAEFMDASSGAYGSPHDATGGVRNWKDELSENDTLSAGERDAFKQGLTDALTSMMDQSLNEAIMGLGMGLLGGMMGGGQGGMNPFGGGMGGMNPFGGGMGGMNPFGGGMGGMDPFGGGMGGMDPFGGGMGGGLGGDLFGNNPFAGGSQGGPFANNPFSSGLSGLGNSIFGGGQSGMGQTGMGFGLDLASHMTLQGLNDIGTHKDGDNRHFVNEGDRGSAEEIGKFMDQHPEMFGKPEYQKDGGSVKTDTKSWAEALSKPDDDGMTGDSMSKFMEAKNIIKDVMLGDTSQTESTAMAADAMLAASNIAGDKLGKCCG